MWAWKCDQQFIIRECWLSSFSTIVDCCRELCVMILEMDSAGGLDKIGNGWNQNFEKRK